MRSCCVVLRLLNLWVVYSLVSIGCIRRVPVRMIIKWRGQCSLLWSWQSTNRRRWRWRRRSWSLYLCYSPCIPTSWWGRPRAAKRGNVTIGFSSVDEWIGILAGPRCRRRIPKRYKAIAFGLASMLITDDYSFEDLPKLLEISPHLLGGGLPRQASDEHLRVRGVSERRFVFGLLPPHRVICHLIDLIDYPTLPLYILPIINQLFLFPIWSSTPDEKLNQVSMGFNSACLMSFFPSLTNYRCLSLSLSLSNSSWICVIGKTRERGG